MTFITKIFGDANEKQVRKFQPLVDAINAMEADLVELSDEELLARSAALKESILGGTSLEDALHESFALTREAARRTLGQRHYDVQLVGGIAMHRGKIVEMRTGEGKTLAATLPVALNAMTGRGVHVVTVNDYLAKRDAAWMGQVYAALGLSVGCITPDGSYRYKEPDAQHEGDADKDRDEKGSFRVYDEYLEEVPKTDAYACDITHGTNNEFGFDYLRDNMVLEFEKVAQKDHYFAIVDEVDSILIDEARTPLIISAPDAEAPKAYQTFARIAPRLKAEEDFEVDEKRKAVLITEEGVAKVEKILGVNNLYEEGYRLVHFLEQSLRAHALYQKDKDYIIRDGEIVIVDEFTGRLMAGRRWSEGLHQAVEAKEGLKMQPESRTLATVTFQNYFRLYEKLSGMTGTAATSAEEFYKVYELETIVVPTNKPLIRKDLPDMVFRTAQGKWKALVAEIKERNSHGQPVLVGTTSIEKNELVSTLLKREGIEHEVLNAKQHAREGAILAQAGRRGAVTVATNMAGRGVDIILGGTPLIAEEAEAVLALGGLVVLGTERHEARRIDNQLRGRAGRQGDPGVSQFFLSLMDDLLRIFGGDKMQGMMERLNVPEDMPIESKMVSKAVESAQFRIEGQNFDIRKHLLEYDDVNNRHREAIYRQRLAVLKAESVDENLENMVSEEVIAMLSVHVAGEVPDDWDIDGFVTALKTIVPLQEDAADRVAEMLKERTPIEDRFEAIAEWAIGQYHIGLTARTEELGEEKIEILKRQAMLRAIDGLWVEHLEYMDSLRDAVSLRGYAQRDPLVEYKNEAIGAFRNLEAAIRPRALQLLFHAGHNHKHTKNVRESGGGREQEEGQKSVKKKATVGRNDPCPCGSGLKYKRCGMIDAPEHKE